MKRLQLLFTALLISCLCLTGCSSSASMSESGTWAQMSPINSMELQYAKQFSVDYYEGGYALITIAGTDQYLLVPEDKQSPEGLDANITVLQQPINQIYLAASSAMDLFQGLDALDSVRMTSTKQADWSLPDVTKAMEENNILYAGKYNTPDYEQILSQGCDIAIESTMIYHNPETKEQLENIGIPVLVEQSSYEAHPLGRMEWIKLYGLLLGKEEAAAQFFDEKMHVLDSITGTDTGKSIAFFYISSAGYANVHKPGDYISKMIEMAGGHYLPSAEALHAEDNALSTMNMQLEAFYAAAKDADYIIYNSTIDGELQTIAQLIDKCELLSDFKAVQNGNVWCTEKNMFQQSTGAADMIADIHAVISGEADDQLTFLHRLQS